MQTKPLGCLTTAGIAAAIITAAAILAIAFLGDNALFSAGPLSSGSSLTALTGVSSHAELSDDCGVCHTPFWGDELMRDRCLACHTEVEDEIVGTGELHAGLIAPITCRSCHTEHKGAEAQITRYDTITFPHNEVGFSLRAHQGNGTWTGSGCLDCHSESVRNFRIEVCQDCHDQRNQKAMEDHVRTFSDGCLGCHDGYETYGVDFQHSDWAFPLEGTHQTVACASCHLEATNLLKLRETPRDCYACHKTEDTHAGSLGSDCATCHTPLAWDETSFDHGRTQFPLEGQHRALPCGTCHGGVDLRTISRECVSCHREEDSHLGGLGESCDVCHQATGWENAVFDHAVTEFQLEDAHALLTCNDCHAGIPLSEIANTCYGCHVGVDAHGGTYGVQCEACHRPTTWQDVTFDHALSNFPLTGAHVGLACEQCHQGGQFQEIGSACVTCHADPVYHQGLFGYTCESCHNTSSWRPATFNQSHRFPLNHGGRSSSCSTCHPSTLRNYTCYNCHEHNQAGITEKHREEGISNFGDCARCHPTGREEGGGED